MRYFNNEIITSSKDTTIIDEASKAYSKIDSARLVGKSMISKEELYQFYKTCVFINSLGENETRFNNTPMEKIMIPLLFSELIHPSAVRIDHSAKMVDMLVRPKVDETEGWDLMTLDDFQQFSIKLYGTFKLEPQTKPLMDLRQPILLTEAYKLAVNADNNVVPGVATMRYIPLKTDYYVNYMYSESYESAVSDGIHEKILELLKRK